MTTDDELHDDNGEQIMIDGNDYDGVNEVMKHDEDDIGVGDEKDDNDNVNNNGQCYQWDVDEDDSVVENKNHNIDDDVFLPILK